MVVFSCLKWMTIVAEMPLHFVFLSQKFRKENSPQMSRRKFLEACMVQLLFQLKQKSYQIISWKGRGETIHLPLPICLLDEGTKLSFKASLSNSQHVCTNLEKSEKSRNIFLFRALIDLILLSNAENFVFTGYRIRLSSTRRSTARLRINSESSFANIKVISVPTDGIYTSDSNLCGRVVHSGPSDV